MLIVFLLAFSVWLFKRPMDAPTVIGTALVIAPTAWLLTRSVAQEIEGRSQESGVSSQESEDRSQKTEDRGQESDEEKRTADVSERVEPHISATHRPLTRQ